MTFESLAEQSRQVAFKQGDLCHFELPVKDLARAKAFYGTLFGWQFQDVPDMAYTLFLTQGGSLGGGFFQPSEQMPPVVANYLAVASIDETSALIERHGGQLLGPTIEVPGHGLMRHFLDSEGTLMALWQAG